MNLLNKLIQQAKKPEGFIGLIMVRIMNSAHHKKTKWGLSKLVLDKKSKGLDIGCGGGNTLSILSQFAYEGKICGIDYAHEAVKESIKKNQKEVDSGLVEVKHGSVLNIPYANSEFDYVTAIQTHYFWPNLEESISEINRVLKNNGKILIVSELYKMEYHMTAYKRNLELIELVKKCRFSDVMLYEDNGWVCIVGNKL